MPGVRNDDSDQGHALSALHDGIDGSKQGAVAAPLCRDVSLTATIEPSIEQNVLFRRNLTRFQSTP